MQSRGQMQQHTLVHSTGSAAEREPCSHIQPCNSSRLFMGKQDLGSGCGISCANGTLGHHDGQDKRTKPQSCCRNPSRGTEHHVTRQHIWVIKHACFHRISNLSLKQLVLTQLVFFFLTTNSNCIINAAQAKFHSEVFKLQLQSGRERGNCQD